MFFIIRFFRHRHPPILCSTCVSSFLSENGEFEEVIVLPSDSRLSPPEGQEQQHQQQQQQEEEEEEEEERVPVVAFRENGLLKPLSGVEDISAQQGPGQQTSSFCFAPDPLFYLSSYTLFFPHVIDS